MDARKIVQSAYDCALDIDHWEYALDQLAHGAEARAAALLIHEHGEIPYQVNKVSEIYREFLGSPDGKIFVSELTKHERDEWDVVATLPRFEFVRDDQLGTSLEELDKRPDVVMLRKKTGVKRRIGFRLNDNSGWFDAITLGFSTQASVGEALPIVRETQPHLAKAIELTRTFALLKAKYQAILSVLDRLAIGIAIVHPSAEVVVANERAQDIFKKKDGLWIDRFNRLTAFDHDTNNELRSAIQMVSLTANGEANQPEKLLKIRRRSGNAELIVDVAPLGGSGGDFGQSLRGGIAFISDLDDPPAFETSRFAHLYGLTAAETEVMDMVLLGDSAPVVSEKRSTSINTAKNQIKAVMAKTGCNSRAMLFRKIARTLPPIL